MGRLLFSGAVATKWQIIGGGGDITGSFNSGDPIIDLATWGDTQDVTHFSSSFDGESYRPFIGLCTQVTDFEPTMAIADADAFPMSIGRHYRVPSIPIQVETNRPQFVGNLVSAENSFLAGLGRKGTAHHRIRKIAERKVIAELVSNFIAPNQWCLLKKESFMVN